MGVDVEAVSVDRAPARLSSAIALVFALACALSLVPSILGLLAAAAGVLALVLGVGLVHTTRLVHVAGLALVGGAIGAGATGLQPELTLVGAAFGVLAWDTAENAMVIGEQLGRRAPTRRSELVHIAGSVLVTSVVAIVGYAAFRLSRGGQPLTALALLVFGVLFLLWAMGR